MTALPPDFQFSQASLQDYVECRRRFQLRYLLELAWPAIQAEPAEEQEIHARQGELFHRLVHQHQLGIPADRLSAIARAADRQRDDNRLSLWWDNYVAAAPAGLPPQRHPEVTLSTPVAGYRLTAKYDLIAIDPSSRVVIVDWKTSRARPGRPWLVARLQTRVYRYVLIEAGAALNEGQPWAPEQLEMIYWFANYPDQPEQLAYGRQAYLADRTYLSALISEISHLDQSDFFLTEDVRRCKLCTYRSLCNRGVQAGRVDPAEDELEQGGEVEEAMSSWESDFDFEQIAEIAY
jgi:CRISPR/Cas system-associated exonuclease Cas4 (RecB family)